MIKREEPSDTESQQFTSNADVKLDKSYTDNTILQALADLDTLCESKTEKSFFAKFTRSFLTTETNIRIVLYWSL